MDVWTSPLALLAQTGDDGLTFEEIIGSLPTDPGSVFALLLMVGFVGVILYFGTRAGGPAPDARGRTPAGTPSAPKQPLAPKRRSPPARR